MEKISENFAKATELLISNSEEVIFIDPYFPNSNHIKPLQAMLKAVDKEKINAIKYFINASPKDETLEYRIEKILEKNLHKYIPEGLSIQIILLNKTEVDKFFRLHNRFVITKRGGIQFPDGLTEIPNTEDTAYLMEKKDYHKIYKNFDEISNSTIKARLLCTSEECKIIEND